MPNQNKNQNSNSKSVNNNVQGDLFTSKLVRGVPISEEIFDVPASTNQSVAQSKPSHTLRNILYGITTGIILLLAFATFWFYRAAHTTNKTAADYGTTSADIAALTSAKTTTANGFVIINGNASVNGSVTANTFSGNGANLSDVDATKLNHQPGSFYQNASNLDAGTLNDARLSGNVVLLGSSPNFTNLLVTGTTTLQGSASLQNTLAVTGAATFLTNISVGGDLTVTGDTNINGLTYNWPATQASGVLSNDGSGNLAWQPVGACASCITDGGNAFGGSISVGTNDANSLYLRTNGVDQVTLNTSGNLGIGINPSYKLDVNGDVNVSAGNAFRIGGTAICTSGGCAASAGSTDYVQNSASLQTGVNFNFEIASINSVGGIIRAKAGQVADLQQWQDSSGNANVVVTKDQNIKFLGYKGLELYDGFETDRLKSGEFFQSYDDGNVNNYAETNAWAGTVQYQTPDSAPYALRILKHTDSYGRLTFFNDGSIYFGGGAGTPDTNLYRSAANVLKTDDSFAIGTLGTTNTAAYLCLNASNILAACSGSASGAAFVQGGNSFGATANLGTNDNNTLAFLTNSTEKMRLTTGGVLEVNSTGTPGTVEKFRVNTPTTVDNSANVMIGTSATTSKGLVIQGLASQTANLQEWQSSTGSVLAKVSSAGAISSPTFNATPTGSSTYSVYFTPTDTNIVRNSAYWGSSVAYGISLEPLASSASQYANGFGVRIGNVFSSGVTTGNYDILRIYDNSFNPASGTSQLNGIDINPIISQSGTASGITRGLLINPTLTSAVDFRGIEIANASGKGLWQTGASVPNYFAGNVGVGSSGTAGTVEKFRVNTPTTVDNLANAIFSTSATTSKGLVIQGAASQTANLQEWQNSAGTVLGSISAAGVATFSYPTATNGADALIVQSTVSSPAYGTAEMRFRNYYGTGQLYLNSGIGNGGNIISNGPLTVQAGNNSSGIRLATDVTITNGAEIHFGSTNGSKQHTTNSVTIASFDSTFNPTSGTGIMHYLDVIPTINQTGGANGITRGIYINPTLTSAADWRSIEIANNSGKAIWQTGASATNYFAGAVTTSATPASTGTLRLGNTQTIGWRNAANSGDVTVGVNASDILQVTSSAADGSTVAQFNNAGATNCTVQPGGTGFACSSDARLKTNVLTLNNSSDIVNKLRGVSFNWLSNPNGQIQSGFIAQELMQVIPGAVSQDSNGFYVANYSAIVPYLVNAFQDSDKRLTTVEAKLNDLQLSQGVFNGGIVAGDTEFQAKATFDGLASFKGQTVFAGGASFEGVTNVKGRLQLSSNNTGSATVAAGATSVHVTLPSGFSSAPNVNLTPQDFVTGQYRVTHVTTTGFDIETSTAQTANTAFYWQAF